MKVIYVAGPYMAKDPLDIKQNILNAAKASIQLWKNGWAAICPHKNTEGFEAYEDDLNITIDVWYEGDIAMLRKCEAIFMLKEWKNSFGAKKEYDVAIKLGIPVFFEEGGYPYPDKIPK